MQEYDTIVLKRPLTDTTIPVGTKGVILMVFDDPSEAYEVEFVDSCNRSLGTFTVSDDDIEAWNG